MNKLTTIFSFFHKCSGSLEIGWNQAIGIGHMFVFIQDATTTRTNAQKCGVFLDACGNNKDNFQDQTRTRIWKLDLRKFCL